MAIIAAVEAGGTKFICGLGTEDGKIIDRKVYPLGKDLENELLKNITP